jgi:hypothetical protein
LGFALHGQGRFTDAEVMFRQGIAEMDEAGRWRWSDLKWLLDGEASDAIEDAGPPGSTEREQALDIAWRMADPLYMVEGNDRLTEHWARLTVARIREDATSPYAMRWGRDLEEILVRFGWELGWDRVVDGVGNLGSVVVGHHHPESRSYFPPGRALRDPAAAGRLSLPPSSSRLQEAYAPAYAPVILSGDAEFFRFPRGDHLLLVGVYALPADTGRHASHGHPAFDAPTAFKDRSTQAGLFLVPLGDGPTLEARTSEARGTLSVEVGPGAYLASLEVWSPARGFAGRIRESLISTSSPPDLLTLSDLVVLSEPQPDNARVEDAASALLRSGAIVSGRTLPVGWEVFGLGWRPEVLAYRLSVERQGRGLLRRLGGWLGLGGTEPEFTLEWEEGSPPTPGPSFRSVTIDLSGLEPGSYRLILELRSQGRERLVRDRVVVLSGP